MKTCFHSHFYANFQTSVTLVLLFGFSRNVHQNVELEIGNDKTPFWEVFAYYEIGKGPIFDPRFGLGKSLLEYKESTYLL